MMFDRLKVIAVLSLLATVLLPPPAVAAKGGEEVFIYTTIADLKKGDKVRHDYATYTFYPHRQCKLPIRNAKGMIGFVIHFTHEGPAMKGCAELMLNGNFNFLYYYTPTRTIQADWVPSSALLTGRLGKDGWIEIGGPLELKRPDFSKPF